ncbi:beta-parvin [Hyalella azteca]|uniref:Beta-parvin n=1 Tax=Hyalella azteca TaxID=294128 RepID=A0A8B7PIS6_HYAAZ|nr:beta-parvin [Hyalella azteca]
MTSHAANDASTFRRSILKTPSSRGPSPASRASCSPSPFPSSPASVSPSPSPPPPCIINVVPKRVMVLEAANRGQRMQECLESPSEEKGPLSFEEQESPSPVIVVSPPIELGVSDDLVGSLGCEEETSVGLTTMTTTRPKSPFSPKKEEASNESFWDKLGTLGRKKKVKEVNEVVTEGKHAIDSPGAPFMPNMPTEDYGLQDNEERSMIAPGSNTNPRLIQLVEVLLEWLNDVLAPDRIIVRDMEEDLYDGCVLHKLIERLTGITLDNVPEVTLSEEGQRQKLQRVLRAANHILGVGGVQQYQPKWSVESIHSKNLVAILHLLVALVRHFRAPIRLPDNVVIDVIIVQMRDGILNHRRVNEKLTGVYDDLGLRHERDAFDALLDQAPDKLDVVKKSLVTFVNRQLNRINLEVQEIETEFHDGCHLCLLMGLLEGYFVPLYHIYSTPQTFDEKLHNVNAAFELMMDAGLDRPKARPEDIVNKDLKSTLRVLYNLFSKYKNLA